MTLEWTESFKNPRALKMSLSSDEVIRWRLYYDRIIFLIKKRHRALMLSWLPFLWHMWSCEHSEMVAERRGLRMKSTSLALWSWTYLYPEFWKINICYLSHPTYSTCYGNPKWLIQLAISVDKIGKVLVL